MTQKCSGLKQEAFYLTIFAERRPKDGVVGQMWLMKVLASTAAPWRLDRAWGTRFQADSLTHGEQPWLLAGGRVPCHMDLSIELLEHSHYTMACFPRECDPRECKVCYDIAWKSHTIVLSDFPSTQVITAHRGRGTNHHMNSNLHEYSNTHPKASVIVVRSPLLCSQKEYWVQRVGSPCSGSVTCGMVLNLSQLLSSHLENAGNATSQFTIDMKIKVR